MYKVKIEQKDVNVKDGFVVSKTLNEILDSGTIIFVEKENADITPEDVVIISGDNIDRKKLLVDTYATEIAEHKGTLENSDYLYTVNLISETKLLERITLPNLKITKRANGEPMTVFEKVKKLCQRYLPYIRVYNRSGKFENKPKYKYDPALEERLNVECPEFTWNTPTLREVLNELFLVADCIPVIVENVLTFIDLRMKGNPIDTSKLYDKKFSMSLADYTNTMTLPMRNVISDRPIIKHEHIRPHSLGGELTTNNALFITQKPIYAIKKFVLYSKVINDTIHTSKDTKLYGLDITDAVVEKSYYDALSEKLSIPENYEFLNHKAFNLYFTRGGKTIEGLGDSFKIAVGSLGRSTWSKLQCLFGAYANSQDLGLTFNTRAKSVQYVDNRYIFAEIEYETIDETTVKVSRRIPTKHLDSSLFDSQSSSSVNIKTQSFFEYLKLNRLSSKVVEVYGAYQNESEVPQLADYIGNKILFHKEVSYYDDEILFKGQLCENYILRDYFTGVISTKRSWEIVDTSQATNRTDTDTIYINLGTRYFQDKPTYLNYQLFDYSNYKWSYFVDLYNDDSNAFGCLSIRARIRDDIYLPSEDCAIIESNQVEMPRTVVIYYNINDNFKVGDKLEADGSLMVQAPVRYVDENGELESIDLILSKEIDDGAGGYIERLSNYDDFDDEVFNNVLGNLMNMPNINLPDDYAEINVGSVYKDNGESIGGAIHFEYVSDDMNKVIIGDDFVKLVSIGSKSLKNKFGFKVAKNHQYQPTDTKAVGEIDIHASLMLTESEHSLRYYGSEIINEQDSWCIYNTDTNDILLAVNGTNKIYASIIYLRDLNIYNNQVDKTKIGDVWSRDVDLFVNEGLARRNNLTTIKAHGIEIAVANLKDFK